MRSGTFERLGCSHNDCVNAVYMHGHMMLSAGDDGLIKMTDMRTFAPLATHRLRRAVCSVCCKCVRTPTSLRIAPHIAPRIVHGNTMEAMSSCPRAALPPATWTRLTRSCCGLESRVLYSEEQLFAATENGVVHVFDYSERAAAAQLARKRSGGFTMEQRQAFGSAIEAARRRDS